MLTDRLQDEISELKRIVAELEYKNQSLVDKFNE